MSAPRLFVTGASGFVGRHVVDALLARGAEVVALTRDAARIDPREGVTVRAVDLLDLDAILPAVEDCAGGVHVAGAGPGSSDRELFEGNVLTARHVAATCRRKPALGRLVAISSAAVLEPGDTEYRRSKIGMEAGIRAVEIDWTMLRPTLVLGRPDESAEMRGLVERVAGGRIVLPNGGRARVQPVFVDDVAAAAAVAAIEGRGVKEALTLAGPEEGIEWRALLEGVRDRTAGSARFASVPAVALRAAGLVAGLAGKGGRFSAAAAFHSADHRTSIAPAREALGFDPRPIEEALDLSFGSGAN